MYLLKLFERLQKQVELREVRLLYIKKLKGLEAYLYSLLTLFTLTIVGGSNHDIFRGQ